MAFEEVTMGFLLLIIGLLLGNGFQKMKQIEKAIDMERLKKVLRRADKEEEEEGLAE